jgi:hypothetical protein
VAETDLNKIFTVEKQQAQNVQHRRQQRASIIVLQRDPATPNEDRPRMRCELARDQARVRRFEAVHSNLGQALSAALGRCRRLDGHYLR